MQLRAEVESEVQGDAVAVGKRAVVGGVFVGAHKRVEIISRTGNEVDSILSDGHGAVDPRLRVLIH